MCACANKFSKVADPANCDARLTLTAAVVDTDIGSKAAGASPVVVNVLTT